MTLQFRCFTNPAAVTIAMRIWWEVQQNILSHEWRDVDGLRPVQVGVERKRRDLDFVLEFLQASDAGEFHRLRDRSVRPQRTIGNSEIEAVTHRPDAADLLRAEIAEGAILFTREMQTFRRNLIKMNLHS